MQTPFQMFSLCCLHNSWTLIRIQTQSSHVVCEPRSSDFCALLEKWNTHLQCLNRKSCSALTLTHIKEWEAQLWSTAGEFGVAPGSVNSSSSPSQSQAGMPERMGRRDLRFRSPTPNLLHGFIYWLIWCPFHSCFSFIRL